MLNFIAFRLTDYLLRNPPIQKEGRTDPISESVLAERAAAEAARRARPDAPRSCRHHPRARGGRRRLLAALPDARSASSSGRAASTPTRRATPACAPGWIIVVVMALRRRARRPRRRQPGARRARPRLARTSPAGIGFDAIAVALLGRSHPVGVLLAGILFGALQAGGRQMQVAAGVSHRPHRHHPGADHRLHRRADAGAGHRSRGRSGHEPASGRARDDHGDDRGRQRPHSRPRSRGGRR